MSFMGYKKEVKKKGMEKEGDGALTPSVPFAFHGLVEPGGFEPPSVSPLPLDLHV
jgi:hypothetical protein